MVIELMKTMAIANIIKMSTIMKTVDYHNISKIYAVARDCW